MSDTCSINISINVSRDDGYIYQRNSTVQRTLEADGIVSAGIVLTNDGEVPKAIPIDMLQDSIGQYFFKNLSSSDSIWIGKYEADSNDLFSTFRPSFQLPPGGHASGYGLYGTDWWATSFGTSGSAPLEFWLAEE